MKDFIYPVITLIIMLFFFPILSKVIDFFTKRYHNKKEAEEHQAYPNFFSIYKIYGNVIREEWQLEYDQKEIQEQIEKEQAIANCFPLGPDHDAHLKKVDELRYSYLCKQGSIDIKKMERKELATKLNSLPKPLSYERFFE